MAKTFAPADPLAAAIEWMVVLRSGEAGPDELEHHRRWCAADPRHAHAWATVTGALQRTVEPLRAATPERAEREAALRAALLRQGRRRVLRGTLVAAGLLVGAGWLVNRQWPAAVMMAQLRTGTGERRQITLADGSVLLMNARTAVDTDLSDDLRLIRLRAGEIIVKAAPDPRRPLVVQSAEGRVQALGTRFLVRQEAQRTLAMVLEHSVRVHNRAGRQATLTEGQATWFDRDHLAPPQAGQATLASWERGMLIANDRPLSEVIDALRPYREGFIRVTPEAGRLRVLGAFPLDNPDSAIESLSQTLPIRVVRYGWLTRVDVHH